MQLTEAAQQHSQDQASMNSMSHDGSDGSQPGQRVQQAGYQWQAVAENVAYGYGDEEQCMQEWMNSPGHRENILGPYTHFGSAVAYSGSTPYYTQDFGADGDGGNFPVCPDGSESDGGNMGGHGGNMRGHGGNRMGQHGGGHGGKHGGGHGGQGHRGGNMGGFQSHGHSRGGMMHNSVSVNGGNVFTVSAGSNGGQTTTFSSTSGGGRHHGGHGHGHGHGNHGMNGVVSTVWV